MDLNAWDFFHSQRERDGPFDSVGSCVGNVDKVLHNFESVPCLTLAAELGLHTVTNANAALDKPVLGLSWSYLGCA